MSAKKLWKRTPVITWRRSLSFTRTGYRKSKVPATLQLHVSNRRGERSSGGLQKWQSVTNACLLLIGVIYAVNLSYPLKLKYTFEVFQKLFLEFDILKMSSKVQAFNKKLMGSVFSVFWILVTVPKGKALPLVHIKNCTFLTSCVRTKIFIHVLFVTRGLKIPYIFMLTA